MLLFGLLLKYFSKHLAEALNLLKEIKNKDLCESLALCSVIYDVFPFSCAKKAELGFQLLCPLSSMPVLLSITQCHKSAI